MEEKERKEEKKIVIPLCDLTGNMVRPWLAAGYECWIVDILHAPGIVRKDNLVQVGVDIRSWLPPRQQPHIVFAFPPCTNLAVSGARWFKEKGLIGLARGLVLIERCLYICEWYGAPYFIENPVSTISTYWRKPDFKFDPCDYGRYLDPPGDMYVKKTCLWTGNDFVMPEKKPIFPWKEGYIHNMAPSADRSYLRSITPMGFAQAVFEANNGNGNGNGNGKEERKESRL